MTNRICDLLGTKYPIVQGSMGWISSPEFVATVSNAGALGVLSSLACLERPTSNEEEIPEALRKGIRKVRMLTEKPFAVNFSYTTVMPEKTMEICIEEKVPVVTTVRGRPDKHIIKKFKDAGIKVIHSVFSVSHAQKSQEAGVDAVVASGYEAGGHVSHIGITTFTLIPQVVNAVTVPVIAAGGIADAKGFIAALALGAEGIEMGTRFLATVECPVHPNYKNAIIRAQDEDIAVLPRRGGDPARMLKNALAEQIEQAEAAGVGSSELESFTHLSRLAPSVFEGDIEKGLVMCGLVSGSIKEIMPVEEVISSILREKSEVLRRIESILEDLGE